MNDPVLEYIRTYLNTYTREAITQVLLDAGHTPEVIAAAWRTLDEEDARIEAEAEARRTLGTQGGYPAAPATQGRWPGSVTALFVVFLILDFTFLLIVDALAMSFRVADDLWIVLVILHVGSLIVFVGLGVAIGRLLKRNWSVGKVVAVVLVTALVWGLIVYGTCLGPPI